MTNGRIAVAPAGNLFILARRAYERVAASETEADVCVILSAAALEGALNELPLFLSGFRRYSQVNSLVEVLEEAEEGRLQTPFKLRLAFLALTGKMPSRGDALHQDVQALFSIRNQLLHCRPEDLVQRISEEPPKPPAYVRHLINKKLVAIPEEEYFSWRGALRTPTVAAWAHNVAAAALLALAAATPPGDAKQVMDRFVGNKEPISS